MAESKSGILRDLAIAVASAIGSIQLVDFIAVVLTAGAQIIVTGIGALVGYLVVRWAEKKWPKHKKKDDGQST
ncbi:MAG: hypothetical protein H7282_05090 [Cytophagaceae bacterium]|nr:hypothetical protein [Cytophagaceae bacterium]